MLKSQILWENKINLPADMIFKYKIKENFKLQGGLLVQRDAI